MSVNYKSLLLLAVGFCLIFAIYVSYPYLLFKVSEWQRYFNSELAATLKSLEQHSQQAGVTLIVISFLYGVFHAVGPGHGKFMLTGYLSFEQTKLPQAIKITLLSALFQGLVAIGLVSLLIALLNLSRHYFNLSIAWVERGSFIVMILFGGYWCFQAIQKVRKSQPKLRIRQISVAHHSPLILTAQHHSAHCGCGHKHLPTANDMAHATDWKSSLLLIVSIGLRPCSGAVLVLFLAYTLDLYLWGIFSALAMALGTGLSLSLFALVVLFFRQHAIALGQGFLPAAITKPLANYLKGIVGIALILFGIVLLHSSMLDNSASLFFRR